MGLLDRISLSHWYTVSSVVRQACAADSGRDTATNQTEGALEPCLVGPYLEESISHTANPPNNGKTLFVSPFSKLSICQLDDYFVRFRLKNDLANCGKIVIMVERDQLNCCLAFQRTTLPTLDPVRTEQWPTAFISAEKES